MGKGLLLIVGILFLFALEILKVYFIMPFPGSQHGNTLRFAYFIDNNSWWLRSLGLLMVSYPLFLIFTQGKTWSKWLVMFVLFLYGGIFYLVNYRFLAYKMFYQPRQKTLADVSRNVIGLDQLVLGVTINGQAKAYPIEVIGYHHQVRDTVGREPVMVTYCTVCRTGRVFSPYVKGHYQNFRLVGMDHFNAMFEDGSTRSWWQQATGVALIGPLKGSRLKEWPSEQMRLTAWIRKHPATLILQPDTTFNEAYEDLRNYDIGTIKSGLEKRDSASWKNKSWVVGLQVNGQAKAYDWNDLIRFRLINDSISSVPLLLAVEADSASFHVWNAELNGKHLHFYLDVASGLLKDNNTKSTWNFDGICTEGPLKGSSLTNRQAYQEFWHSWKQFHPNTTIYAMKDDKENH
mgnify:FL=1